MVATPYASGLAALVDDEAEMGAACIDMGGGTTTFSVFTEGRFVHAEVLPIGGHHVTMDLARGLSTSLEQAERLRC
jgi:cell division protein FtsA